MIHKQAEEEGWFKLDVLNNSVYTDIAKDETHQQTAKTRTYVGVTTAQRYCRALSYKQCHYDIVSRAYNHQRSTCNDISND